MKIRVAVVGATGYSGVELLRLLIRHPKVEIQSLISSESSKGKNLSEIHPYFQGKLELPLESIQPEKLKETCDLIFFCTPSGITMQWASQFYDSEVKIIDLSRDFRLSSSQEYERYYQKPHLDPESLKKWVYGVPEFFKESIQKAQFVANPGCYPISILLGVAPYFLITQKIPSFLICDSKSGFSGKGRVVDSSSLYYEVNENFFPYQPLNHPHIPEIQKALQLLFYEQIFDGKKEKKEIPISFTPHLIPMDRGILSSIYIPIEKDHSTQKEPEKLLEKLYDEYQNIYRECPFVQIHKTLPQTKEVAHTNECHISLVLDQTVVKIFSAIDNLMKGASGTAVQNFNLMYGFPETMGFL